MNWVTIAKQRNIIQDGSKYLNDMSVAALMGANRATPLTPPRRTPRYQPRHALHPATLHATLHATLLTAPRRSRRPPRAQGRSVIGTTQRPRITDTRGVRRVTTHSCDLTPPITND